MVPTSLSNEKLAFDEKFTHIIHETDRMKVSKVISGKIQKGQIINGKINKSSFILHDLKTTKPIKYHVDIYDDKNGSESHFEQVLVKRYQ